MKIKVCGMKYPDNIRDLYQLPIDMVGMIFYSKSPRYIGETPFPEISAIPSAIEKVGVFVNENTDKILSLITEFNLQIVQLHGDESPSECKKIKETNTKVIKAFSIEEKEDFNRSIFYEGHCDYFLFDTKTPQYGGSGRKFDWNILSYYTGNTPFLLSGGISEDDTLCIKEIKQPLFAGIDLNSKFELFPGIKDINKLKQFINHLTK